MRVWTALCFAVAMTAVAVRADEATDVSIQDGAQDSTEDVLGGAAQEATVDPNGANQQPQISQEVFAEMMQTISPECRAAIEASPQDASDLSEECKLEVQTTLHKLLGGKVRDPNDPVTPEIFDKMMEIIPSECRAEVIANPQDASKLSDDCKGHIQATLTKLIAKEKRKASFSSSKSSSSSSSSSEEKKSKKQQRRGKKETKGNNTGTLLIVLGFVFTAFAGIAGYAYTLNKKYALNAPQDRSTQKKLSKNKKEKELRRQQAAAAASIN